MEIIKLKGYNNIYCIDSFLEDYSRLFGRSQKDHEMYLKKLRTNLRILDTEALAALQYQQFEKVENTRFYSIRHVSKLNPRVIFAFVADDGKVILLSSFKEKNKSDYTKAVEQARFRITQLEESL